MPVESPTFSSHTYRGQTGPVLQTRMRRGSKINRITDFSSGCPVAETVEVTRHQSVPIFTRDT
ncbi:hypothetical protein SCLCIDRAFT_1221851 [Scleroderma citrinum Foug A]|uniref:Uncharacterized protein n=1 Tax=Scleroderma citrinum Foug A TaxID=1036808 RepID=A0A0C3DEZ3_9AGAM|nr:hypothetical protein SCLCIDRAFT_1221851 [Scleroderma citrinum Foug A]